MGGVAPGMLILLFALGLATGTLGGAIGIGGGIMLAPLLLYLPGPLGLERLDVGAVAALTIVHSFAACLAGTFVHRRLRNVHLGLALTIGGAATAVSFVAALASGQVSDDVLTVVLVVVLTGAAAMMLIPLGSADRDVAASQVEFDKAKAVAIGVIVGLLGGLVGQGGSFLVVPAMLYVLAVPTRVTIGTSLAVAFAVATAGVAGKALSSQLELTQAAALAAGALIGSSSGAFASQRVRARTLRLLLALLLWVTSARLALSIVE